MTHSGSGWGISFHRTYGLTYSGIRTVLTQLGLTTPVADTLPQLQTALADLPMGHSTSLVTDKGLITEGKLSRHAISLFVRRTPTHLEVFDNDSLGHASNSYTAFPPNTRIIASTIKRQHPSDPTCNTFAITDCIAFQPSLLKEITPTHLPDCLMTLANRTIAHRHALRFQCLLIRPTTRMLRRPTEPSLGPALIPMLLLAFFFAVLNAAMGET
jgi:hypothetical protein